GVRTGPWGQKLRIELKNAFQSLVELAPFLLAQSAEGLCFPRFGLLRHKLPEFRTNHVRCAHIHDTPAPASRAPFCLQNAACSSLHGRRGATHQATSILVWKPPGLRKILPKPPAGRFWAGWSAAVFLPQRKAKGRVEITLLRL